MQFLVDITQMELLSSKKTSQTKHSDLSMIRIVIGSDEGLTLKTSAS